MIKVKYCRQRSTTVANSSQGRWLLATFAAVVGCTLWAVTIGAEQVDSGWAIGIPSPFPSGKHDSDPQQQMLLRRVLEETNSPLLKTVPGEPADAAANGPAAERHPTRVEPRIAARPEGVEGWHSAEPAPTAKLSPPRLSAPPINPPAAPPAGESPGPRFSVPKIPPATARESTDSDSVECDGSGQPHHEKTQPPVQAVLSPSLADAYDLLPSDTSTAEPQQQAESSAAPAAEIPSQQSPADLSESDCGQSLADAASSRGLKPSTPAPAGSNDEVNRGAVRTEPADAAPLAQAPVPVVAPKPQAPSTTSPKTTGATPPATAAIVAPSTAESVAPPPLTKQLMALRSRVRAVLKGYYRKQLNDVDHDPWEVMHAMLAYELQSRVRQGGPNGAPITSVGWLCYNKPCKGQTLLYVNPEGEVRAKYGVGLQGHLGQLLAMLAQCHVSQDYPVHIGKNEFAVRDLIHAEMKTCYPKSELTFKLIALQHYIDLDEKWTNDQGVEWDFSRLMSEEMAQSIRGAACGGTHRLSGLSLTVKKRLQRGEPLDGEYARAAEFVKKYQQYAFRLQNRDGSLSTQWFRGAGDEDDLDRRIKTTGHILEWLCYSLSDEELRDQRAIRAVTYLANLMYSNFDHEWEIGPRSHALHALLLYDTRVFQPFDGADAPVAVYLSPSRVAKSSQSKAAKR